ncbi:hypothetical protein DsansV1_C11g0107151 [Dioscorea sansibarensis]
MSNPFRIVSKYLPLDLDEHSLVPVALFYFIENSVSFRLRMSGGSLKLET